MHNLQSIFTVFLW